MSNFSLNKTFVLLLALFASVASLQAQQARPETQAYLQQVKSKWNLTDRDISDWAVSDQYINRQSGIIYTYLHQTISGVRIYNAVSTLAMQNGQVVYYANRFHRDAASRANSAVPVLTPENAIQAAATHLGLVVLDRPVLQKIEEERHRWNFDEAGVSRKPIRVELLYVNVENTFRLAWNVIIAPPNSSDWWNVRIDAQTGAFISQNNWTVHCDIAVPLPPATRTASAPRPVQQAGSNGKMSGSASYNVFPLPVEAPSFGVRGVLTDPSNAVASPYGWHDIDGQDGPEFTITQGNNVYAYEDRSNLDAPGYSPDGGPDLQFDFPLDLSQSPEFNQDADITNLFYLNNTLHDILYVHGFDERAGNFQANNYGKGGIEGDFVAAEAQDGGGNNNADFATPPDGESGRMQMYLWASAEPATMTINTPAGIAGTYTAPEAGFGPGLSAPVTGDLVLAVDGTAPINDGCEPITNAAAIAGKIALVDRGKCNFTVKVANAEAAGAIAVVVVNNAATAPYSMPGNNNTISIPSVMISQAAGTAIKGQISAGETVNITLYPQGPLIDGSLDNGVVAHEYGHGLSIRLTGGPDNSNCLDNNEQGGEGWSDWLALILTIEPGDAGADVRPMATYAFGEATNGGGLRRQPYSTDMAVNNQTYADLASSSEVHDIGEIWAQVLWDMTWNIIDAEGFDPDWFNGKGGNNTAMNLVIEAMKLQPCGPGYLDARDAILAADEILYNNAHRCMIWEAFARRGMGKDADQGSPDIAGDETAGFKLPNVCLTAIQPPKAAYTVDFTASCFDRFQFTDQSTDIPQTWLWDFGDGTTSDQESPVHVYATPGTYTVTLTVSNTIGSDSYSNTVTYTALPAPVVSGDITICTDQTATLTATVDNGYTADWSTDGTVVYTGTTFQTPSLNATTTYAVRQIEDKPIGHVGPVDNTFGGGGNHNTNFDGKLLFEAYAPFRLLSVLLIAQGDGNRTITLFDAQNNPIQSVTVFVPNGASRVTLNLDIPEAGLYSISNQHENLYRNNAGAAYPYTLANVVRIYSSNSPSGPLTYYYYFYDWEVQEKPCASQPTPLTVTVTPGPVADFSATPGQLVVAFSDLSTGSPTSWSWNFGDGSAVSTQQNPSHTYAAAGTYTVSLTVTNGGCSHTYEKQVTVSDQSSGLTNVDDAFGLRLFPNPAADQVYLEFQRQPAGPVTILLTDAGGRLLRTQHAAQPANRILLSTAALDAGVYSVRVVSTEGSVLRKLILIK